jgi:hypothetical protein
LKSNYIKQQERAEQLAALANQYGVAIISATQQRMLSDIMSLQEQLREAEDGNTLIYCPTCSSCGEEGCCSPGNCVAVKCLYENSNLKSYWECRDENEILWKFLQRAKESPQTPEDAQNVQKEIEALWDKTLEEHQKQLPE